MPFYGIIYLILNIKNSKCYVGLTTYGVQKRWEEYKREVKSKSQRRVIQAIRKHGIENFIIVEIDGANSLSELGYKEKFWIHTFKTRQRFNGYNVLAGGIGEYQDKESRDEISKDRSRQIVETTTGVFYESSKKAAEILKIPSKSKPANCASGIYPHVHGFKFKWVEEWDGHLESSIKDEWIVETVSGTIYKNIQEVISTLNISKSRIRESFRKSRKHTRNPVDGRYIFKKYLEWDGKLESLEGKTIIKVVDTYNGDIYDSSGKAGKVYGCTGVTIRRSVQSKGEIPILDGRCFVLLIDWDGKLRPKKHIRTDNNRFCKNSSSPVQFDRYAKPILHINTNTIYKSALKAAKSLNLKRNGIVRVCAGERKHYKSQKFKYI